MIEDSEWYLFVLAAMLIAAVYYMGVKTDLSAFSGLVTNIGNTFTGRNPEGGPFQSVPSSSSLNSQLEVYMRDIDRRRHHKKMMKKSCLGKTKYTDETTAINSAVALTHKKGEKYRAYKCNYCSGYHIGHRSKKSY